LFIDIVYACAMR